MAWLTLLAAGLLEVAFAAASNLPRASAGWDPASR